MEILFVMALSLFPFALVILFAVCYNKINDKKSRIPFDYARTARIPAFTLLQQHRDATLDMLVYSLLSTLYFQLPFSEFTRRRNGTERPSGLVLTALPNSEILSEIFLDKFGNAS